MSQAPYPDDVRPAEPRSFAGPDWTSHPRAIRRLPNGDLVPARRYDEALARMEAEQMTRLGESLEGRF
ncbi:hypothetical protein [Brevundimonas sp.]|uniref:hypothetical protein n=1 Tax=Brevundimonas sp. TaxID=1871086 RepID=UPI0025EFCD50|nr:hypothetical protein [Brevundimonas sp.]